MKKIILKAGLVTAVFIISSLNTHADDHLMETSGLEIARKSDNSDNGFGSSEVEINMTLSNKAGQSTVRKMKIYTMEREDETVGDKTLVYITYPPSIQGTALLTHAKNDASDQQWLYLPSIKRTKRISSSNKSGAFLASEFTFEDFASNEPGKFEHTFIGLEKLNNAEFSIVKRVPLYENSGYSAQKVWYDNSNNQIHKIEYYNLRNEHIKTMKAEGYMKFDNLYWRPRALLMVNHLTGKSSELAFGDYKFGLENSAARFESRNLAHVK